MDDENEDGMRKQTFGVIYIMLFILSIHKIMMSFCYCFKVL